jgi:hypothetical protein
MTPFGSNRLYQEKDRLFGLGIFYLRSRLGGLSHEFGQTQHFASQSAVQSIRGISPRGEHLSVNLALFIGARWLGSSLVDH